ncbi:Mannosyl oligosaccharide glucosidase [Roseimaritima multifibrata]|uniref:Mannosyl oligosaccharide glucosidase n=1 Tax=Roseimaritima multifibrata TaxID=1930274 RepID=A0A517MDE0_9BACT|nr:glucosidase [Roseimaritima multifibrata]QDS92797.1 Mannosyl oligosaccharide glucosidase [Roseimaritima multifibrata]
MTPEHRRLQENEAREVNWKRWGPYLSERQWGTVREDYSEGGNSWRDFSHEQSRSRAYRWGEDGLLGLTDRECRFCFSIALWNGNDPILKERLFGLTGPEGNHGEDVKECYYYLDSTPTHSYCKGLYRYPHAEYPYGELKRVNADRGLSELEYEINDTGIFAENRFFDVQMETAKKSADDILVRLTITNHGPDAHSLCVLPQLWFRNTWVWGCRHEGCSLKPRIEASGDLQFQTEHETLEPFTGEFGPHPDGDTVEMLFTENETNQEQLFDTPNFSPYTKDAFHRYVVDGELAAVNPKRRGTKVAGLYRLNIPAGESREIRIRWQRTDHESQTPFDEDFQQIFTDRIAEADQFYATVIPKTVSDDERLISRQAYAGLLWTKQFYHYIVEDWLHGDDDIDHPPEARKQGRNHHWQHMYARDILSMPDKWEYPWFAAWDLAFHMIPMAKIDPEFAKRQLTVLLREWYMHPNGQMPAYEFDFGDVNPPVHAWACLRVYQITAKQGKPDRRFLATAFQRLLMNFTWWVNQVDGNGDNVFAGGFLGLDNIGVFDRSAGLPENTQLEQADGTAWMAFYCATMLSISLELAREDEAYAEMASKFLDHFIRITDAMNTIDGTGLWNEDDQFYYDHLQVDGQSLPLKVRSLVGLLPLIAVEILDRELIDQLPAFKEKLAWFLKYRHDLVRHISFAEQDNRKTSLLLSIPSKERLKEVIATILDESEFLSDFGIRSMSKRHATEPFEIQFRGEKLRVAYVPGESDSWMFGGNSNWRGPIWFPINFLLCEALERYHDFYGDDLQVECPKGSGNLVNLQQAAEEIYGRLGNLFRRPTPSSPRACLAGEGESPENKIWHQNVLFYEYFHGDTGRGLGASHQTGWTALIATCIEKLHTDD